MTTRATESTSLVLTFNGKLCEHLRSHLAVEIDAVFLDEANDRGTIGYITPGWRSNVTSVDNGSFRVICHPAHDLSAFTTHDWLQAEVNRAVASAPVCCCA